MNRFGQQRAGPPGPGASGVEQRRSPAGTVFFRRMTAVLSVAGLIRLAAPGSVSAAPEPGASGPLVSATFAEAPGSPSPARQVEGTQADPISEHPLTRLRELYYAAVNEREAIGAGLEEIDRLRRDGYARPGSRRAAVLDAYAGAITTLRAKHGRWPLDRLRHLNSGLGVLDSAVADAPDAVEVRYLRLMSCYYLPGILGRGSSVRDDFQALARLLPDAAGEFPAELYRAILTFVVENGDVEPSRRAALESALRSLHTDSG